VVDVVPLLALLLVADHRRTLGEGLLGRGDRLERLVVDVDQLDGVLGDVRRLRDDGRDLLPLEAHLVRGENGLCIAGERRHPGQVVLGEELARDHGDDARESLGARGVDRRDARVGVRAAQELEVEHARQRQVVEVLAPPLQEAGVFEALDGVADAADLLGGRHG
jgi:hypothetical protein